MAVPHFAYPRIFGYFQLVSNVFRHTHPSLMHCIHPVVTFGTLGQTVGLEAM